MFRLTRMKLDRAKQRMKELEEALQSFYAANPFKFSGKADQLSVIYPPPHGFQKLLELGFSRGPFRIFGVSPIR